MKEKNRPTHQVRLGRIRASVWENRNEDQDVWFTVKFSRLYREGEQWRDSDSFRRDDLLLVSKAATMAFDWIHAEQISRSKTDSK